jgi:hypothetical protein
MANYNEDHAPESPKAAAAAGPFLAKVVSHLDPTYMGVLEVEILRSVGNDNSEGQLHQVKMMTPFWGQTDVSHVGEDPNDYNNTQKSYGMWMIPPDPGSTVMVIFIDGDPRRGFWIGCVPDENMNFMVPGNAATEAVVEGGGRLPVAEYNKKLNTTPNDPTKIRKPAHTESVKYLEEQGLVKDDTRGITTSSARREVPSAVFGISTPGPLDKRNGAKRGKVGKSEHAIPDAFVSRLGGTTFVMDDGDDKYLRKTPAGGPKSGPPEYVAVEQGETGGDPTIPHNELFRIRTRTGHQILLHNSEDLIYIGNAKGTTWIELTSEGKIDIYAKDSVSVYSNNDINLTAERDINLTSIAGDINLNSGRDANMTATRNTNVNSAAHVETAGTINMNGPVAAKALKANRRPGRISATKTGEPWMGHENLNPKAYTKDKTRAVAAPVDPTGAPKYSTTTDTFSKIKPPEEKKT